MYRFVLNNDRIDFVPSPSKTQFWGGTGHREMAWSRHLIKKMYNMGYSNSSPQL